MLSMCFNRAAQASLAVCYATGGIGLLGAYLGTAAQIQNKFFIAAIAGYAAHHAFKGIVAGIDKFRHDVYVRDHGTMPNRLEPPPIGTMQVKAVRAVQVNGTAEIVDLKSFRDRRASTAPK